MTSSTDSPADSREALLRDLLPADDVQQARIADVTRILGTQRVHRRALPVRTTQLADSLPAWAAGMRAQQVIGPIRDQFGRDIFFEVFVAVQQVRFVRSAGGAPFMTVPLSQIQTAASSTIIDLGAGSFWIATRLLADAAGEDVYTGLRIARGRLFFDQHVVVVDGEVIVQAGNVCRASLELDPPPAPEGTGPGRDVRESMFRPPARATFHIAAASAVVTVEEAAAIRVYGQHVDLQPAEGAVTWNPLLNRVTVPLTPSVAQFNVGVVHSSSLRPEGSAPLSGAGWALPAARIVVADLGEASGVGALALGLDAGLSATWIGQTTPVALGQALLLLDEARLAIMAPAARAYGVSQHPALPDVMGHSRLMLAWNPTFPLSYFAQANDSEVVFTFANFRASLDKPVDVNGERVSVDALAGVIYTEDGDERYLWVAGVVPLQPTPLAFGLRNAVLLARLPVSFSLYTRYDGTTATRGMLALGYALMGIVPSLPDPYATNAIPTDGRRGYLITLVQWKPDSSRLEFLLPPAPYIPLRLSQPDVGSMETVGMSTSSQSSAPGCLGIFGKLFGSHDENAFDPANESGPAMKALGEALQFESEKRLILLDLSSNVGQFGVALRAPARETSFEADPPQPVSVRKLDLAVDGRLMVLLTLPAVQWEAVHAEPVPDDPAFPRRLGFAKNGVPALIDVPTVDLVPVTPEAALDTIVDNFAQPDPLPARARFTLPFGMIGSADLRKPGPGRGALVTETRPKSADGVQAGRQLRIEAADPSLAAGETPALPGFAAQLPNAIPGDDSPGPRSILGTSVSNIFNGYLGEGGASPLVPVTRIDLSGYGESLFSGWINPADDETQVSKADFKVLVGRTAHEVVQVRSILLPYHVPVVRTVTLERRNNAVVTRHDSGWIAAGDGAYQFRSDSGIVTHPGAVDRITNVTHIRETGNRIIREGIEFAAVYYQGDLLLGGAAQPVPVSRHFGYVKIGTTPLTPSAYAALLADAGPLCGPIDTTIRIGLGPRVRLHRIGVGVAEISGGPQFVMTAWGGIVFPGGGDWSILQAVDATGAPQPVPKDEGLPLIRANEPSDAPWRFAHPSDLGRESAPERDYGILHSTGTQRAFFRRPKIELADLTRIVSTEQPVIADPYLLATALGPFPRQEDAIHFPSEPWALAINDAGHYRLEAPAGFAAGIGARTIRQAGSVKSNLDYTDSVVTYRIDTAEPVPWAFSLTNAKKIMNHETMGDLITLVTDIHAQAGQETVFSQPRLALGGSLSIVEDLLTILADLGITGSLRTVMTNKWALAAAMRVPFVDPLGKDLQVPPLPVEMPNIKFADTGITVELEILPHAHGASFKLEGIPSFLIQAPFYVAVVLGFEIELSTEHGTTYKFVLGVGVSFEVHLIHDVLELEGLIAITFAPVFGDDVLGYSAGFLLKAAAVCRPIAAVEVVFEGRLGSGIAKPGTDDQTSFLAGKLAVAVEISVFLVLSIEVEYETTYKRILNGPLPEAELPDVL